MKKTNETFTEDSTTEAEVKEMIRNMQQEFDNAELHADTKKLQELLTEDFLSIGPKGFVLDKEQWINRHKQFSYQQLETSDMTIRLYDNTAIVCNIQKNEATFNSEPVNLTVRVTQVWIRQPEGWQLASIQFSPLTETK